MSAHAHQTAIEQKFITVTWRVSSEELNPIGTWIYEEDYDITAHSPAIDVSRPFTLTS